MSRHRMIRTLVGGVVMAASVLGFAATTATQASADPAPGCGSHSTLLSDQWGPYYNLTYRNCSNEIENVRPWDENWGWQWDAKAVWPGDWVSWSHLSANAWNNDWQAFRCGNQCNT